MFKTFEQQADLLINRGMSSIMYTDNAMLKSRMISCLASTNYYRLSAYWYPFREINAQNKRLDSLQAGTHWEKVWSYYLFDRRLRSLMFDVISKIEIALRTQIAYNWSKDTSKTSPQNFSNSYKKKYNRSYLIGKVQDTYKNSKTDCAIHFRNTKNIKKVEDLPIWVFVEFSTLGNLTALYSDGLKTATRADIARYFGFNSSSFFESAIRALCNIRNACAHQERFWNKRWNKSKGVPYLKKSRSVSGAMVGMRKIKYGVPR